MEEDKKHPGTLRFCGEAPVLGADHVADHGLCQSRLKCKIFAEAGLPEDILCHKGGYEGVLCQATKCQPCFVTEKQKAEAPGFLFLNWSHLGFLPRGS